MKKYNFLKQFSYPLLEWYQVHGRKNLPWQYPKDAYRTWISEIMLQQTQVQTVIAYFNQFMLHFPTVQQLAQANEDSVLSLWSGLGYYSRARNLHKSAKIIVARFQGSFPKDLNQLTALPGIGPSTAAAILSQAHDLPHAILDANVKRVLSRFFMIKGWPEHAAVKKQLKEMADLCMPEQDCADYTQAIMDLGALCCTARKPNCLNCPVHQHCLAYKNQQQQNYPGKKAKKAIPTQQQQFLVLLNKQGQVYLEKRPPVGIWGGLWCLPAIDLETCPLDYIKNTLNLKGEKPKPLMNLKHRFSHLLLEINALCIQAEVYENKVSESNGRWFAKNQLNALGLARPTQTILQQQPSRDREGADVEKNS